MYFFPDDNGEQLSKAGEESRGEGGVYKAAEGEIRKPEGPWPAGGGRGGGGGGWTRVDGSW